MDPPTHALAGAALARACAPCGPRDDQLSVRSWVVAGTAAAGFADIDGLVQDVRPLVYPGNSTAGSPIPRCCCRRGVAALAPREGPAWLLAVARQLRRASPRIPRSTSARGMKRFRGPRVVASMRAAEARSASGTGSDAGAEALERTW